MSANQATAIDSFVPGTSRRTRSVHSLALRIAEELDLQMTEGERGRREAIARRLRELRGPRPQPWVATKVGVSLRAYQAWEAGDSGIAWENIEALAKLWSVPEDYIVYGGDHGASPDQVAEILTLLHSMNDRLADVEKMLLQRETADLQAEAEEQTRRRRKPPDTGEAETS